MGTIVKIAWRNVWRNKLRSFVVITSMVLGLWSGLFTVAMSKGINDQRVKSAIDTYLHHVQIHNPSFEYNFDINSSIKNPLKIVKELENNNLVKGYSSRIIISAMASTAHGAEGVRVIGVDSKNENQFSDISKNIIKGNYFSKIKSKPALIGQKLADNLKLDIKKKLSFTFVDDKGDLQRIKFKVEGIFKTANSIHDNGNIYVKKEDLNQLLIDNSIIHEVAILSNNIDDSDVLKHQLQSLFPKSKVETWKDISPELGAAQGLMVWFFIIFMSIILLALSFGIANIMLMAVLERKRELGMLMSVGLNKTKIFLMILFETIFISFISLPAGIILSYIMISYYGQVGIDLSIVSEGLEAFGMKSMVYTHLPYDYYIKITILTLFVTLISSLFPARRALKLDPAEAVRSL
jgi:putative ABC transport system permease protein|tara:strand:- start:761 stop:1981 length:1221 start_codon:yes stop_codon:yes gene_type:complete